MDRELEGEVAGVTGGAQGIGRAVAIRMAEQGCQVAVFDLPEKAKGAEETIGLIKEAGGEAVFLPLDVRQVSAIPGAMEGVADRLGPVSIWVNNAGVVSRRAALEVTEDEWDRVVDVCLKGTFFCAQAAARLMRETGGGRIVNMASVFGLTGGANRAAYAASKAGIVNLTRALAIEWFGLNIRVNAVAPTFVRTPLTEELLAKGLDVPNFAFSGQFATLDQVCDAVHFLATDHSAGITGHTLPVDLGWTSW